MKRKICVITGTRAEYGLLNPVMKAINSRPGLELLVMATGMHLSEEFGKTINFIKEDMLNIACKVEMNVVEDNAESMALAVGKGILGMTKAFKEIRPHITVVLGDRIEALAGAITSAYLNIPVAHIHGGDISMGGLDESARHAITKIAHIHFAASKKSKARIIKMGERPENVFLSGAPGLDAVLKTALLSRRELEKEYNLDFDKPFLLLLQHSVTTQIKKAKYQIIETLDAVKKIGLPTVIIYPNSDAGGRTIINEIEKLRHLNNVKIFKSVSHQVYLSLLKYATLLIGNSSSGIIESLSFELPVVNIGIRQQGRERCMNVIDVPHDRDAIIKAIRKACCDRKYRDKVKRCKNPYGDGHASERIAKVLSTIKLDNKLLQKQIAY